MRGLPKGLKEFAIQDNLGYGRFLHDVAFVQHIGAGAWHLMRCDSGVELM